MKIEIQCQACQKVKPQSEFTAHHDICDECVAKTEMVFCEPCAKLDANLVPAVTNKEGVDLCKRCAHAVEFMMKAEKQTNERELMIMIRLGKVPF